MMAPMIEFRRRGSLLVAALACGALCAWGSAGRAETAACGAPGKPPCPLQQWMRVNIAAPMAEGHRKELAENLERLVKLNPDPGEWQNWNRFAREGAERARKGRHVQPSCTRCHDVYRAKYNEKYRERAVPAPVRHTR